MPGFALFAAIAVFVIIQNVTADHKSEERAVATLYLAPKPSSSFAVSSRLALPDIPSNRSWYAVWLMLLTRSDMQNASFIQVGLIRRPDLSGEARKELMPFVAYRLSATHYTIVYQEFAALKGPALLRHHVFTVGRHSNRVYVRIDDRILYETGATAVLDSVDDARVQIGAEVSKFDDLASGVVWDVHLFSPRGWLNRQTDCGFVDRGVAFQYRNNAYVAAGRFERGGIYGLYTTRDTETKNTCTVR